VFDECLTVRISFLCRENGGRSEKRLDDMADHRGADCIAEEFDSVAAAAMIELIVGRKAHGQLELGYLEHPHLVFSVLQLYIGKPMTSRRFSSSLSSAFTSCGWNVAGGSVK
jgi:hypothetical protein